MFENLSNTLCLDVDRHVLIAILKAQKPWLDDNEMAKCKGSLVVEIGWVQLDFDRDMLYERKIMISSFGYIGK